MLAFEQNRTVFAYSRLATAIAPTEGLIPLVSVSSLVLLALLGGLAARAGGAGVR
jgi:hypothetical protein